MNEKKINIAKIVANIEKKFNEMREQKLKEECNLFKQQVEEFNKKLTQLEKIPQFIRDELTGSLSSLTLKIIDLHKLSEYAYAYENKNVVINPFPLGYDMKDIKSGGCIELKTSIIYTDNKKSKRANAYIELPSVSKSCEDRINILKIKLTEKTINGGMLIRIMYYDEVNKVYTYFIKYPFIVDYAMRKAKQNIEKNKHASKLNLGSNLCLKCNEFHRLKRLAELSLKNNVTDDEWNEVLSNMHYQCK